MFKLLQLLIYKFYSLVVLFVFITILISNHAFSQEHNLKNPNSDCKLLVNRCSRGEGCSICYACQKNANQEKQARNAEDERIRNQQIQQNKINDQKRRESETKQREQAQTRNTSNPTITISNSSGKVSQKSNGATILTNPTNSNSALTNYSLNSDNQMTQLGINPNEDYLVSAVSSAANFFGDMFRAAQEKRRRKEQEQQRIKDGYIQQINSNLDEAKKGNTAAIKEVGYAYWFLSDFASAREWFMRLLNSDDKSSAYVALANLEKSILADGIVSGKLTNSEKDDLLKKELSWHEKAIDAGVEQSYITMMLYYLGIFSGYNDDIYFIQVKSKDDRSQLSFYYDIYKPISPWKGLKDLDKAYALAKKAMNFNLYKPIKIVSNYTQYHDNKTLKQLYDKACVLREKKKYSDAMELLQKAADKYYIYSINDLGAFYDNGWSVPVQQRIAFKYYKLGAELGDVTSMQNLYGSYFNGVLNDDNKTFYIKPDKELAQFWFDKWKKADAESKW